MPSTPPKPGKIRLICWDPALARDREKLLKAAGIPCDATPFRPSGMIGQLKDHPPAAILIDLDRMPSHGREVAQALRASKSARHIPIIFAGGEPAKVDRLRTELPDAFYTDWKKFAPVIKKAVKEPPANPVRTKPHMQRYTGSDLAKKLGLKPGLKVALLGAEDGFAEMLEIDPSPIAQSQLVIWFVHSSEELARETAFMAARLPQGASIWIVYPKQSGRIKVDFNQFDVRALALEAGLVDYKICAVNADWTGLKFARRKTS